jgi:energy-coupling factor transporter ATP-binding protein EcfA2
VCREESSEEEERLARAAIWALRTNVAVMKEVAGEKRGRGRNDMIALLRALKSERKA